MKKKNAFSLMEMMVVLLIISIIAAASAPMINKKMLTNASETSPWVWTGLNNNITYNLNSNARTASIGTINPPGAASTPRLYIDSNDANRPQIAFGNGGSNVIKMLIRNGGIGLTNEDADHVATNSVVIGKNSSGGAQNSVAIGHGASASGDNSIAIGIPRDGRDKAGAESSISIGNSSLATGGSSTAVGPWSITGGTASVALGFQAQTGANNDIALGRTATAGGGDSIALGSQIKYSGTENGTPYERTYDCQARGGRSIAIGSGASATGGASIAIGDHINGDDNQASGDKSTAVGHYSRAQGEDSTALGSWAYAHDDKSIALGYGVQANGGHSVALGAQYTDKKGDDHATTASTGAVAIGPGTQATGGYSVAIGTYGQPATLGSPASICQATATSAIAIGISASALSTNSIAIGSRARASFENSVAIGAGARTSANNEIVLGTENSTVYIPGNLVVGRHVLLGSSANRFNNIQVFLAVRDNTDPGSGSVGHLSLGAEFINIPGAAGGFYRTYSGAGSPLNNLYSDIRLKNVGKAFIGGLEQIRKLEVFNYTFKDDKTKTPRVGVMAQDLQKIFPDAVIKGEDGFLRIRMEDMFYALVNAVKQNDKRITELEKQNKELVKQNQELLKRISALEKKIK